MIFMVMWEKGLKGVLNKLKYIFHSFTVSYCD